MSAFEFPPPRQRGLIIHAALIVILGAVCITALWLTFQAQVGPLFALFALLALVTFFPLPYLGYRAYALQQANYSLDRDFLRLAWGFRIEDIPISDVEWVRSAQDLATPLTLPLLHLPGGVLGVTRHPDLGRVEFLAADSGQLLLVATRQAVFAISPQDAVGFTQTFQHTIEMGSLASVNGRSQYPSFVINQAWESAPVRYLWMAGLFLNLGLTAWVAVVIPSLQQVALGFEPTGAPLMASSPVQLLLLPLISLLLFVSGWLAGLFFYRRTGQQAVAVTLWASSSLAALIFLMAVYFLIGASA